MLARVSRFALVLGLSAVPLALFSCEGEDRKFVESGGGTSGRGGGAGDASIGGNAGQGGSAGDAGPDSGDGGKRCTQPSDCNDGDSCNGVETCSGGYCQSGTALANGTSCTPVIGSVISGGDAGDAGDAGGRSDAGDGGGPVYICAAGACLARCESDDECNDNDVCTGNEICSTSTHTCTSGTPKRCEDDNPCTENKCDPIKECYFPLIDADDDGHAAKTLGTCGDDCNDNDKTIYTGAAELCSDNKDNNCNGQTDESKPMWYPDCDNDTFAAAGAVGTEACDKPAARPGSCDVALTAATWTLTVPTPDTTDCWDRDARVRPFTAADNSSAWQTGLISGRATGVDADWNCDRVEEQLYTGAGIAGDAPCEYRPPIILDPIGGATSLGADTKMVANQIIIQPIYRCSGLNGYMQPSAAACNSSNYYSVCEYDSTQRKCVRSPVWRAQQCR